MYDTTTPGDTTTPARITVLITAQAKARIASKAKKSGLSLSEYFRQATAALPPSEAGLPQEYLIDQLCAATERGNRAIDDALDFINASNRRIAMMETRKGRFEGGIIDECLTTTAGWF